MARKWGSTHFDRETRQWYAIPRADVDPITGKRGTRPWIKADPNTEEGAELTLARIRTQMAEQRYVPPDGITLAELLDKWLERSRRELSGGTIVNYSNRIEALKLGLGHIRLQKLTVETIEDWWGVFFDGTYSYVANGRKRKGRPHKPSYVKAVATLLTAALDFAIERRLIVKNPARGAKRPRERYGPDDKGSARRKAWTAEDLGRVLERFRDERLYPLYRLVAASGLRREELCGLRLEALNLAKGFIVVEWCRTVVGAQIFEDKPKTVHGFRTVYLDPETVQALKEWLGRREAEAALAGQAWNDECPQCGGRHVFVNLDGSPLHPGELTVRTVRALHEVLPERYPARTLHGFRHTHCTLLLDAGMDPETVRERLGHSSVLVTLHLYAWTTDRGRRHTADTMGDLLRNEQQTALPNPQPNASLSHEDDGVRDELTP